MLQPTDLPTTDNNNSTTVHLSYGKTTMPLHLPPSVTATIIRKKPTPVPKSASSVIHTALDNPIGGPQFTIENVVQSSSTSACILICDITRPVPNHLFLRPMINRLTTSGIDLKNITVLVATGLHRPNLDEELEELVGDPWVTANVAVINNYARNDDDYQNLGVTPTLQVPALVHRVFMQADIKIATGLVEPHFMAGFSGGRKVISPGICHHTTIRTFHSAKFMEDRNATSCNLVSNPLHEAQLEIVALVRAASATATPILALNTILDEHRHLVHATFGEIIDSHLSAVSFVRASAQVFVPRRFPIVVTSAGGYPLDKTYYQTVKGMVTPLDILQPGGTLIICSECSEGMGSEEFIVAQRKLIDLGSSEFLNTLTNKTLADIDEWQTEELVKSINVGRVVLYGPRLDDSAPTGVERCGDLNEALLEAIQAVGGAGGGASGGAGGTSQQESKGDTIHVAVVPEGPYVVPFKKTDTTTTIHTLSQTIQTLSPAVWSSITFKHALSPNYLSSWLKIKKHTPTQDLVQDLEMVIQTITLNNKRTAIKNSLIKSAKSTFKTYQKERSKANNNVEIIAPISATPNSVVSVGLHQLLKPTAQDVLCDLGCGDGRWLIQAALEFGCRCIGVDVEEERLQIGRARASALGLEHLVELRNGDIFETDLSECTMVICYLFGESTGKVKRTVLRTLRHGAKVLSVSFQFKQDEGGTKENGTREEEESRLELVETLEKDVERKLLLYTWFNPTVQP